MKKRIVTNALCSWAEAVALSAGEDIGSCRITCSEATIEVFQSIRQVSKHLLLVLGLHILPLQSLSSTCEGCVRLLRAHQPCSHAVSVTMGQCPQNSWCVLLQKYSFQVKRRLIDEASMSDSTAHLENMVSGFVSILLMSLFLLLKMHIRCQLHCNALFLDSGFSSAVAKHMLTHLFPHLLLVSDNLVPPVCSE